MIEALQFLAAPLVLATLLVGIHTYLGLHVLERDVIFVDISLSQVSVLGGTLSLLWNPGEEGSFLKYYLSLAFCLVAALLLAVFRKIEKKLSQEVLIGITYAFASGTLILIADRLPHGAEHIRDSLVGNILYVTWSQVAVTAIIYFVVGLFHYWGRRQFWNCTRGLSKNFIWDFLFYLLFGVVITFSSQHAGVLVVFCILIVPSALAKKFLSGKSISQQLLFSWAIGWLGMLLSFLLSYRYDLPAGATIVTTLTGGFFMALIAGNAWDALSRNSKSETQGPDSI